MVTEELGSPRGLPFEKIKQVRSASTSKRLPYSANFNVACAVQIVATEELGSPQCYCTKPYN